MWVTTPDRSELLAQRPPVTFGKSPSTQPTIVIDPDREYQTVDGFGASITDSSAAVLAGLAPAVRADTMRELFDPVRARNIVLGTTRNWARSVVNWNIALDSTGGPHNGGCGTCTGLVTVHPDGSVTTDAEYYTIGHLAKFVKPGARRVASTSFGTTGWNGQIMDAAFRNPDGSTALVVHNQNDDPRSFAVNVGDRTFEYTLPGGALATFTWPRGHSRSLDFVPINGATAAPGPEANLAVDDDASTRWSSGAPQANGQYLHVDLGARKRFRRVAVDSGGYLGDYARNWQLEISDNGTTWRTVATGTGGRQLTTIDVRHTSARFLRITSTSAASAWWSVADIRLYD